MTKLTSEGQACLKHALATRRRISVEQQRRGVCITLSSEAGSTMLRTHARGDGLLLVADGAQMVMLAAWDFALARYMPIAGVAGRDDEGYRNMGSAQAYVCRALRVRLPGVLGSVQ